MIRTALVTGGDRGIGLEVCRQLAAAGLTVVLTARDADRARAASAEVGARMGGAGAPTPVRDGADTVVRLATRPDGGPTDGFWHRRRQQPW